MIAESALAAYAAYFETFSRGTLDRLDALVAPEIRFKDPFNDVRGAAAMKRCLAAAFDHGTPRFEVVDRALGERAGYLRWRYVSTPPEGGAPTVIEGMSEVRFDAAGRVVEHVDHWDAGEQVYARVPVLGRLIGLARRRLSAKD